MSHAGPTIAEKMNRARVPARRKKRYPGKPRVEEKQFQKILKLLADGQGLKTICNAHDDLPHWHTVLNHVQASEDAYRRYRNARVIQAETYRDQILEIAETDLPSDAKLAMAEVQRRKLEVEGKHRYIGSLQPRGVRDRDEDVAGPAGGSITIQWGSRSQPQLQQDQPPMIDVTPVDITGGEDR